MTGVVCEPSRGGVGHSARAEELFPVVYDELRRLARGYMSRELPGNTLQPTALVHEAYLKLVDQTRADWKSRTHFFAVGARVMQRLLVDHDVLLVSDTLGFVLVNAGGSDSAPGLCNVVACHRYVRCGACRQKQHKYGYRASKCNKGFGDNATSHRCVLQL